MWYLNFCSPFLFKANTQADSYRYVMYSEICALFLIYLIFVISYKFASEQRKEIPKIANQDQNTLLTGSKLKCMSDDYWVSSKTFKEWYLSHFAMHAVAVGTCIFYSPYLPQMIFTIVHFVLWIIVCFIFHLRRKNRKAVDIIYKIIMVLVCILNIMLLFSGTMGVGASGYDENAKLCLLQSGTVDRTDQKLL